MNNPKLWRVLASNRYQYQRFLELFDINKNNARFIRRSTQLIGLPQNTEIVCVNDYQEAHGFSGIYEIMIKRSMRPIEVKFD